MNLIEDMLRQTIGLHAPTIGSSLVERAARARMRLHGLAKTDDYLLLLEHSPAEWDALLESVLVAETWFFRDRASFSAMVQLVLREWLPAHPAGILRLLSVPCATGEEPYSMAMALLDAGLPGTRFQIDARDINGQALARARRAVYRKNSFRDRDTGFRDRFFSFADGSYTLNPAVRRQVRFQSGNIVLDGHAEEANFDCASEPGSYDVIFCRNLLIYFDAPTQHKTLAKLSRLLAPSGVLFVGAAEMPLALDHGFVSADLPLSFACRQKNTVEKSLSLAKPRAYAARLLEKMSPLAPKLVDLTTASAYPPEAALEQARRLAKAGRLAEAAEICEAHLRQNAASAEAYFLLGQARHAAGAGSQAGEFYRRALYLEPGHFEALTQWALLSEQNGNPHHARILQQRAERLRK